MANEKTKKTPPDADSSTEDLQKQLDEANAKLEAAEAAAKDADAKIAAAEAKAAEAISKAGASSITVTDSDLVEVVFHGADGSEYHGSDTHAVAKNEPPQPISAEPGDSIHVSPKKAQQLLSDFPCDFALAGEKPEYGRKVFRPQAVNDETGHLR